MANPPISIQTDTSRWLTRPWTMYAGRLESRALVLNCEFTQNSPLSNNYTQNAILKQTSYVFLLSYFLPFSSTHCSSYAETSAYSQLSPTLSIVVFTTAFTETLHKSCVLIIIIEHSIVIVWSPRHVHQGATVMSPKTG